MKKYYVKLNYTGCIGGIVTAKDEADAIEKMKNEIDAMTNLEYIEALDLQLESESAEPVRK